MQAAQQGLSWVSIVRLGLVQTALGAIVVLTTSTLNRVMVVEVGLAATVPGALVALHYAVQMLRPRFGHISDNAPRRTPWILFGICVLALGGAGAAAATSLMLTDKMLGLIAAVIAFLAIGFGVGLSGTSLLATLAEHVAEKRRAAAATIVWMMMIAGFVVTTIIAGKLLDPFSPMRLIAVSGGVSVVAVLVAFVALWGVEPDANARMRETKPKIDFKVALKDVWNDREARRFTYFVFISMLAYNMQDLILEPFAGAVFTFSPGESTKLSGVQHGGVLAGMILMAVTGSVFGGSRKTVLKAWMVGGCLASAIAVAGLCLAASIGPTAPLKPLVFALGLANGSFAVAAIASMMALAKGQANAQAREGTRMGVWGAAQAIAFGLGGFVGTVAIDIASLLTSSKAMAYGSVFALEGLTFLAAALLAARINHGGALVVERSTMRAAMQNGL